MKFAHDAQKNRMWPSGSWCSLPSVSSGRWCWTLRQVTSSRLYFCHVGSSCACACFPSLELYRSNLLLRCIGVNRNGKLWCSKQETTERSLEEHQAFDQLLMLQCLTTFRVTWRSHTSRALRHPLETRLRQPTTSITNSEDRPAYLGEPSAESSSPFGDTECN